MKTDPQLPIDAVADAVRGLILDGRYKPGDPLRQDRLSDALSISRTPLRQALVLLSAEGLVALDANKGARVETVSRSDIDDLFEMRLMLEPLALNAASPHLTKLDFAAAEMAADAADDATAPARLSQLNWEFHAALYAPCGRRALMDVIKRLNRASAFAAVIAQSITGRKDASQDEHRRLLEALRAGDAPLANGHLIDHLRAAQNEARFAIEE